MPYSIGKSVEGRDLLVLALGGGGGQGRPKVRLVAGLHGNDMVGREMALEFARSLCSRYKDDYKTKQVCCLHLQLIIISILKTLGTRRRRRRLSHRHLL